MVFSEKHRCSLGSGSDSMLPKMARTRGWNRCLRRLWRQILISERHPLTFEYMRSYPAVVAERQRHVIEAKYIIHPFSVVCLIWNTLMLFVDSFHLVVSSFRLCYILDNFYEPTFHHTDLILLSLNCLCYLDIFVRFHSGYFDGIPAVVILDRRSIACNYLKSGWVLDVISTFPASFLLLALKSKRPRCYLFSHILPLLRTSRICSILENLKITVRVFTRSVILRRVICHILIFGLTLHGFNCLLYVPPVFEYYWNGFIPEGVSNFLKQNKTARNITQLAVSDRYIKAIFISISHVYGTGFTILSATQPLEILINSIIIVSATVFMIYNVVFFLKLYMTIYNSSMRYQELMNQVEKYMRHKQFPATLKKRVRSFYNYRYQQRYFKEETSFLCLTEQLRSEISLYTCQNLVKKVSLFHNLPTTLVGTILGCLKSEVYLQNDIILRAGDLADCMYFLSSGTVVVYSMKGAEVCHLEDGAYFGALALLLKDKKRLATVVAIEITQVYRLDEEDFRRVVMTSPELVARIEADATRCSNETVLIDDAYRRERERLGESPAPFIPNTFPDYSFDRTD